MRKILGVALVVVVVLLVALGALFARLHGAAPDAAAPPIPPRAAAAVAATTADAEAGAAPTAPAPATPAPPAAAAPPEAAPPPAAAARATTVAQRAPPAHPVRGLVMVDDGSPPRSPGAQPGAVSRESVRAAIHAVTPKVRDCYEKALKVDPALGGKVTVAFTIEAKDGAGAVTEGEVADSDVQSPFFEACVLKEVAGAKFDAPGGGGKVTVRYPFTFASDDAPAGGFGGADDGP